MQIKTGNSVLAIVEADITEMDTDAIVNAANTRLILGGGVAGAIRKKGGAQIQQECDRIGHVPTGGAVKTTAGSLKTKYVIHTAGPKAGEGNEDTKLKNSTVNCLKLADHEGIKSIAFPAVSTGIYGFPIEKCAEIMLRTTIDYLNGKTAIEKVVFCLFDKKSFDVFEEQLQQEISQ